MSSGDNVAGQDSIDENEGDPFGCKPKCDPDDIDEEYKMKFGDDQYDSATEGTKKAETAEERGRREAERPIDCDLCDGE